MAKEAAKKQRDVEARKEVLEEIFNDIYDNRRRIYWVNFTRGIFFGIGSLIGGTIAITLGITLLSQFVDWFPILGDFVNSIIEAMNRQK